MQSDELHPPNPDTRALARERRSCLTSASLTRGLLVAVVFPLAGADALEDGGLRLQGGTVDGGGRYSAGARYAVEGTIGQPEPGRAIGGRFVVNGGFWAPTGTAALPVELIFRNGFED